MTECFLSVLGMFAECSLSVLWVCSECAMSMLKVCSECTPSVLWACLRCAPSVLKVCSEWPYLALYMPLLTHRLQNNEICANSKVISYKFENIFLSHLVLLHLEYLKHLKYANIGKLFAFSIIWGGRGMGIGFRRKISVKWTWLVSVKIYTFPVFFVVKL